MSDSSNNSQLFCEILDLYSSKLNSGISVEFLGFGRFECINLYVLYEVIMSTFFEDS
ncbi:5614_t:CDS:1, partial [Cetraspora pellucida]